MGLHSSSYILDHLLLINLIDTWHIMIFIKLIILLWLVNLFLGYQHVQGQVLDAKELKVLFEGLQLNNLHHFSHLLTGRIIYHCITYITIHQSEGG